MLVAFHDKTLDRVTDRTGAIASPAAPEVAAARIDGTDPIPLLEDLLGAWPDVRFNIDVKDAPAARPLAELIRKTAAWDRICITSFSRGQAQGDQAAARPARLHGDLAGRCRRAAVRRAGRDARAAFREPLGPLRSASDRPGDRAADRPGARRRACRCTSGR